MTPPLSVHPDAILPLLEASLAARLDLLAEPHREGVRLFNGFLEGYPRLVVELFGRTLVIYNFADPPQEFDAVIPLVSAWYLQRLDWLEAVLVKTRYASDREARMGLRVHGAALDDRILENGVWYALDLRINQDASLYLDTRLLRAWLAQHMQGLSVLNLFAYTGSLGIAALAGGARRVVQVDRSRRFLNLAKTSCTLNGFAIRKSDFVAMDFWAFTARMRRLGALFDCVLLDPPYFSSTAQGSLHLESHTRRLVNKVRPLVAHQGCLVVINNALYVSGTEFLQDLESLDARGHLSLERLIEAPADVAGVAGTRRGAPPVDPTPFNHSTKIAVLRARRKDGLTGKDVLF